MHTPFPSLEESWNVLAHPATPEPRRKSLSETPTFRHWHIMFFKNIRRDGWVPTADVQMIWRQCLVWRSAPDVPTLRWSMEQLAGWSSRPHLAGPVDRWSSTDPSAVDNLWAHGPHRRSLCHCRYENWLGYHIYSRSGWDRTKRSPSPTCTPSQGGQHGWIGRWTSNPSVSLFGDILSLQSDRSNQHHSVWTRFVKHWDGS